MSIITEEKSCYLIKGDLNMKKLFAAAGILALAAGAAAVAAKVITGRRTQPDETFDPIDLEEMPPYGPDASQETVPNPSPSGPSSGDATPADPAPQSAEPSGDSPAAPEEEEPDDTPRP